MSTEPGGKAVADGMVGAARALLADAAAEEQQLELLEPLTAAEIEDAQERLGPGAGTVAVLREARARKRGRTRGSRNKRTDDFARYILGFGQDPAVTLMQIQTTPEEELVARSKLIDSPKRQLSLGDAISLRVRCAEALLPFIHSKRPIAVDATIRGVMVVEEVSAGRPFAGVTLDAEPLGVLPLAEDDE